MPGTKWILTGGLLVVAGVTGLWLGYTYSHLLIIVAGWVSLPVGLAMEVAGFMKFFNSLNNPRSLDREAENKADVRALVQAIGAIAAADGQINPEEVKAISAAYHKLTGVRISDREIDEILFDVGSDFDVSTKLKKLTPDLNAETRRNIILSCYEIMIADKNVDIAETRKIGTIGKALGFKQDDIDKIIANAT